MKLVYMNDEKKQVKLRVLDSNYDSVTCTGDRFYTLEPGEAIVLDLNVRAGSVPFIKKWPSMVMISDIDSAALPQLRHEPQCQGAE